MTVHFNNQAGFDSSFSIQWNGGESGRTSVIPIDKSTSIETSSLNIPDGTSCWVRAYVQGGANHDSSDNFTFHANSSASVSYFIDGTTTHPSFSCQGC